jgi:hypothetical protein
MWYLYLDESGDLGFDFVTKKPSKFFTITILAVSSLDNNKKILKAVKTTLRRKFRKKDNIYELKGRDINLSVKKYLYKSLKGVKFGLYSMTLNKKRVYEQLTKEKSHVYNFIARKVLDQIPFEKNDNNRVELIIDKSMSKPEIVEFNSYIRRQLEARLNPRTTPLDIYHWLSHENYGLQAVDIFCWGIFQKYEKSKTDWYDVYKKDKIKFEEQYL